MNDRPLWFLDVDGVLNAGRHQQGYRRINVRAEAAWGGSHDFRIRYSAPLVERIADMGAVVSVVWCTTWGDQAVTALSPRIGLPVFPVAEPQRPDESPVAGDDRWWKYARVAAALFRGHRVVWTDDDIPNDLLASVNAAGGLAIRPHPNAGLKPVDVDAIDAYCRRGA